MTKTLNELRTPTKDEDYGNSFRQFHRHPVSKAAQDQAKSVVVGDAYDPQKRTSEEEKKLEEQRKSEKKFTVGNKEYPDKGKDAEPEASGEYAADADLIPIDDHAVKSK